MNHATAIQFEQLALAGSGLHGTRLHPVSTPGALFIHGWTGSRQDMAGPMIEAAAAGFACLGYDLRGHGATAGEREAVTLRGSLTDALHAYDALVATPGVDAGSVALVGSSFGGWLAALVARERPVRWLVLRVPALYPDRWWDLPKESMDAQALADYRHAVPEPQDDQALAACAAFKGEVLLIWSGQDEVLPRCLADAFQVAFQRAQSLTVRRLRDADHGLSTDRARSDYRTLLGNWLSASLAAHRRQQLSRALRPDPA